LPLADRLRRPDLLIAAGLVALAFCGLFFRWFHRQHRFSIGALDDWGHTYVIPLIAGYLLWQRGDALARARMAPYWPGMIALFAGIASYFFFLIVYPNHMFQGAAMLLALFGVLLLLLGTQAMRALILPLGFLALGITISERVMIGLTFPLQKLAADGGYVLTSILGYPFGVGAEVAGNTLTVQPREGAPIPLNVAEACSGMRMVVAFVALGAAVAVIQCHQWWQRIAVLLLAPPVAILLNVARVTTLAFASLVNPDFAAGQAHTLIGTLLLIPGLLAFLGIVWALRHIVREPEPGATA
jgi:exosortase